MTSILWSGLAASSATSLPSRAWEHRIEGDYVGGWAYPLAMRPLADNSTMIVFREGWPLSVVRYGANGAILSAVDILLPSSATATDVAIDPFGSLFVIFGGSGSGLWTMSYDGTTGKKLWPTPVRFDSDVSFFGAPVAVTVAPNGDALVTGHSGGTTPHTVTYRYERRTGALLWAATSATASGRRAVPFTIAVDPSGDVVVAGIDMPDSLGGPGWTLAKHDGASGREIWKTEPIGIPLISMVCPGSCFTPVAAEIAFDSSRGVFLTVSSFREGGQDWLTLKYDGATGRVLWGPVEFRGSGGFQAPQAVAVDGEGNVIVSGLASLPAEPWSHRAIVKYEGATGRRMWGPVSLGGDLSRGTGFVLDGLGNPIVAGSESSNDHIAWSAAKYSGRTGAPIWRRTFFSLTIPSTGSGEPRFLALHSDGRVVVSGTTFSAPPQVTPALAFAQANGASLWGPVSFPGAARSESTPVSAFADSKGNPIVAATSGGRGEGGAVVKYSRDSGTPIWGPVPFSEVLRAYPMAGAIDRNDDVFVTGTLARTGGWDWATVKYDGETGSVVWDDVFFDRKEYDRPLEIVVDPGGNPIILGESYGSSGSYSWNLMKYDGNSGAVLWGPIVYDPVLRASHPRRLAIDAQGDVFVTAEVQAAVNRTVTATFKYRGSNGSIFWGPIIWDLSEFDGGSPVDIEVDRAGDVVVIAEAGYDSSDWAIVKYSGQAGTVAWGPRRHPRIFEHPVDLALDGSNDVLILGHDDNRSGFHPLKLNGATGDLIWTTGVPVGSSAATGWPSIAVDVRGDAIVLAPSRGPIDGDWITVKYSGATGGVLWGPTVFDGGEDERPMAMAVSGTDFFVSGSHARTTVTVRHTEGLAIESLGREPDPAYCGHAYRLDLSASNGQPPYVWSLVEGSLPPGLFLQSSGEIAGEPTSEGAFNLAVRLSDSAGAQVERSLEIQVGEGGDRPTIIATNSSACSNGYLLEVSGTYASYRWLSSGATTPSLTVCPELPTVYGVVATDGRGCPHRAAMELGPRAKPARPPIVLPTLPRPPSGSLNPWKRP